MEKSNASDKAYEIIFSQITNFDLHPGQVVSDYLLSKGLEMSRTPIRQALHRLEMECLVEKTANASTTYCVAPITVEEIQDLFDFREGIETTAFRLAVKRGISTDDVQILQNFVNEMVRTQKEGKVKKHFICDQQFHNALVALSHNKRLLDAHGKLLTQISRMRFLTFLDPALQDKACFDHQNIVKAIQKGEYKKGEKEIVAHIRTSCEDYQKILSNGIPPNLIHLLQVFSKSEE